MSASLNGKKNLPHAGLEGDELPSGLPRPIVDRGDFHVQALKLFPFLLVKGDPALHIDRQSRTLRSQLLECLLDVAPSAPYGAATCRVTASSCVPALASK